MNIIIAGASRGIGSEVVKQFARTGDHQIVALSRNEKGLKSLEEECASINTQARIVPVVVDLGAGDFQKSLISKINMEPGSVDVLLYNAGLLINKPFAQLEVSDFDRTFDVNIRGAFLLIKTLVDYFKRPAHIVTISSMGGYQGSAKFPGLSLYSASKGSLAILTECLAEELKDQDIRCNCLALGAVQTEMLAEAFPDYKAPLNPDEMAEYIVDFAVNGHRYFNGKILPVSVSTP